MSDALIAKLRDHENEGVTGSDRFHLRNEAADALSALREERDRLRAAILWALGEGDDFPDWPATVTITGNPKYWWRKELRQRAALGERSGERE